MQPRRQSQPGLLSSANALLSLRCLLAGLGGYSLSSGKAWQFQLPTGFGRHLTLNTLEFLGCITTIWVELLAGRISPLSCVLSQTDSTSADGWLKKSNFCEFESPAQLVAARHLATLVINADIQLGALKKYIM